MSCVASARIQRFISGNIMLLGNNNNNKKKSRGLHFKLNWEEETQKLVFRITSNGNYPKNNNKFFIFLFSAELENKKVNTIPSIFSSYSNYIV